MLNAVEVLQGPGGLVTSSALPVAAVVALAAGGVSFASPCVLPLVPGFLGYVTGLSGQSLGDVPRGRVVAGATLFVAGFTGLFVAGAAAFATVGSILVEHRDGLLRWGGAFVIVMALAFLGAGRQLSWQPRWRPRPGLAGAPLLGMVFGIGWAPCTGPTLASVMMLVTTAGDDNAIRRGVVLAVAYCAGLGLPFVLVAAGLSSTRRVTGWLRRHHRGVQFAGGAMLLTVGILMVSGVWDAATSALQARLIFGYVTPL